MNTHRFDLNGKTGIVIGGSYGLGKSIALALAEAGSDLAVVSYDAQQVEETVSAARKLGIRALAYPIDPTERQEVAMITARLQADFGNVDILVNAEDLLFAKPLSEITDDDWHSVIDVNLRAMFLCCQYIGGLMLSRKAGRVINLTSGLGEIGMPNGTLYCAAKGAVIQFTRALALEWARDNIMVNAIAAGWFSENTPTEMEKYLSYTIPMRRLGKCDNIAGITVYLASDALEFITGQVFYLDGGLVNMMPTFAKHGEQIS